MFKLYMAIKKELLLLQRDTGGIIILFVMPLILLIAVTMVQSGSFDSILGTRMEVLLVDNDQDSVSARLRDSFRENGNLTLVTAIDGQAVTEAQAQHLVHQGAYQLAIVLPKHLSRDLDAYVKQNVDKILAEFDFRVDTATAQPLPVSTKEIKLYFDPAAQAAFKTAVRMSIDRLVSSIESQTIYKTFQEELGEGDQVDLTAKPFIAFKEVVEKTQEDDSSIPNAAQHNVPAWALFAIFFIVVPLSINIVKEKAQGTMLRIGTSPTSYMVFLLGKTVAYLMVSLIQFYLMLLIGVYLFPYLGLQEFQVGSHFILLTLVALFSGLAAVGLGVLIGTVAKTQEQAAPFGATLTVVLAALGGVWVPVFVMPLIMQKLSVLSPMNWGLSAFYDVLLREAHILQIIPAIILLFLFFVLTLSIAVLYDKKKKTV
ncbi:ABC transporter permease [Sphingobacterium oryzagri]|uniref:ABC transporter permease n=1 Tax=Sphingobacterium oryzagri TaxID=3025669 RepID=A0ABY7WFT3_9SPHI|nr:ABC transporter permease [Sphingobacterium sp. KACC 22765]WDF68494.1 ABC transporter permease [Sphingobacterium sp. KACC 22765]